VEEAANEALEAVEEMQGMLEDVREASEVLDTQEEMREVRVALEKLWMVLAGIAAVEEDRRLKGEDSESDRGEDRPHRNSSPQHPTASASPRTRGHQRSWRGTSRRAHMLEIAG
jgi:hypothetical protein